MTTETPEKPDQNLVDLAELVHHDRGVRAAAVEIIRGAFHTLGHVRIVNHGVDFELRDRAYTRFLSLSQADLDAAELSQQRESWYQRGWCSLEREGAREAFRATALPPDQESRIEYPQLSAPNRWPDDDEAFEQEVSWLGQQLHEAGLSVLTGVAMGFGLTRRTFDRRVEGAPHLTQLARSSAASGVDTACLLTVSAGPRLLDGAGAPSAENESEGETAGEVPIVAYVGEQLEILSGGQLRALPEAAPSSGPRVEATHQLHLAHHELVTPLTHVRSDDVLRRYAPPVLAGTYRTKSLVDRGLAPASALARLGHRGMTPQKA